MIQTLSLEELRSMDDHGEITMTDFELYKIFLMSQRNSIENIKADRMGDMLLNLTKIAESLDGIASCVNGVGINISENLTK